MNLPVALSIVAMFRDETASFPKETNFAQADSSRTAHHVFQKHSAKALCRNLLSGAADLADPTDLARTMLSRV